MVSRVAPGGTQQKQKAQNEYRVVPGDTMTKIARQHGVPLQDLIGANKQIKDPNLIFPGQALTIPQSKTAGKADGQAAAGAGGSRPPAAQGLQDDARRLQAAGAQTAEAQMRQQLTAHVAEGKSLREQMPWMNTEQLTGLITSHNKTHPGSGRLPGDPDTILSAKADVVTKTSRDADMAAAHQRFSGPDGKISQSSFATGLGSPDKNGDVHFTPQEANGLRLLQEQGRVSQDAQHTVATVHQASAQASDGHDTVNLDSMQQDAAYNERFAGPLFDKEKGKITPESLLEGMDLTDAGNNRSMSGLPLSDRVLDYVAANPQLCTQEGAAALQNMRDVVAQCQATGKLVTVSELQQAANPTGSLPHGVL
jgi:hypothetical protein